MVADGVPGCFRGLDIAEEFEIALRDDAGLDHCFEVYDLAPELFTKQQNGDRQDLACLIKVSVSKSSSIVPKPPGKAGAGAHEEVHLPYGEVVKLKTKIGRDVGVGVLLVRQGDVKADALCVDIRGRGLPPP